MLFSSGILRAVDQFGSSVFEVNARLLEKRAQLRRRHTCSILEQPDPPTSTVPATQKIRSTEHKAQQRKSLFFPSITVISRGYLAPESQIQAVGSSRQVSFMLPSCDERESVATSIERPLSSCLIRQVHGIPHKKALFD